MPGTLGQKFRKHVKTFTFMLPILFGITIALTGFQAVADENPVPANPQPSKLSSGLCSRYQDKSPWLIQNYRNQNQGWIIRARLCWR